MSFGCGGEDFLDDCDLRRAEAVEAVFDVLALHQSCEADV
jgi:hypothetical protein